MSCCASLFEASREANEALEKFEELLEAGQTGSGFAVGVYSVFQVWQKLFTHRED